MKLYIKNFLKLLGYKIVKIENSLDLTSEDILKNIFKKDSEFLIFDIGAHFGQSAKKFRKIFSKANIFSFEPDPDSFKVLSSIKMNRFKPLNIGFSDKKSQQKFSVNSKTTTNSLLPFAKDANQIWGMESLKNISSINCDFNTIDEFCNAEKIDVVDFMKVDVQGSEYLVLDGAKNMLSNKRLKVIQLEVIIGDTYQGQKSLGFYINLLEKYGYKLINFSDAIVKNGVLIQIDLFFSI